MRRMIVLAVLAVLQTFPAWGQSRGMVRVLEPGTGTEVALYEESHALIIGNSAYTNGWGRLGGVRDDVPAVKAALEAHGFRVEVAENLATREAMQRALDGFVRRFGQRPNNRLLIYYAGHGHTAKLAYGGEMGYLVPTSAPDPARDPDGFHSEAISMEEIGSLSRRIQAKHALFVFDSCFSGTVFKAMRSGPPPSIQRKTGLPVRQFITSGDKDQPVPDRSVFRRQFVAALNGETDAGRNGYLTGTELGGFLETSVGDYTRNSQTPQHGKLLDPNLDKGDFVFVLKPPVPPPRGIIPVVGVFPQVKSVFKDCADCPEMVVVPSGSFMMGSPENEPDRYSDEGPRRTVRIPRDFAVGRYEVTQAEWRSVMGSNPSNFKGDRLPVEQVSWNEAQEFARRLSAKTKQTYRLLTEAEWEYAARAGTTTPFSTGRTITPDQANFDGNFTYNGSAKGVYRKKTTPAGSFSANGFGLHDMHGNVWEWVENCYVDSYRNAPGDGSAVSGDNSCPRVLRGGSWNDSPNYLRSAYRNGGNPDNRSYKLGFRVARTLP